MVLNKRQTKQFSSFFGKYSIFTFDKYLRIKFKKLISCYTKISLYVVRMGQGS